MHRTYTVFVDVQVAIDLAQLTYSKMSPDNANRGGCAASYAAGHYFSGLSCSQLKLDVY
jgi:hypothetical protein